MGGSSFHETVNKSDFSDAEKAYEFLCREADEARRCDYEDEDEDYSCDDQLYNGTISTTCGFYKVTPPKVEQKKSSAKKKTKLYFEKKIFFCKKSAAPPVVDAKQETTKMCRYGTYGL